MVAVAGLGVALVTTGLLRWLGVAAVVATLSPLWHLAAARPWWRARRDRLPLVFLAVLMVVLLGPLLAGEPPSSRDHGIHYFQIRMLVEEFLPQGRLWGWSDTLNGGYPYGESYPILGYLWMAAAHLLTFGMVSLRTSYAWGLAALWMLSAAVAWWLASSVTREIASSLTNRHEAAEDEDNHDAAVSAPADGSPRPESRSVAEIASWAGLVAAAAWLLDPGASRQGGWNYLMFHGVWPQLLAATLWAWSLGLLWRALQQPSVRRLSAATLVLGASLWAHPFALLTMTTSAAAFAVVILAVPSAMRWRGPWRTWLIVHLGAALVGAAWLATFFASAESMARAPVPWTPLADLGRSIVQGELLGGHWAWTGPMAVLGAAVVVRKGGAKGWLVLGIAIAIVVLASEEAITVLRLDLVLSGFKNLQFPRYAIPLKPLWFALAGVGVGGVLLHLRDRPPSSAPSWTASAWLQRGAAGLLLAPLIATLVPDADRLFARPVGAIDTLSDAELHTTEAELLAALRREAESLPDDRPLVVAVMREGMSGATYPIATVADAGGRLVLDSHIPTVNFKHRVRRTPASYASLGVTHVIRDRAIPEDEERLGLTLTKVGRYGPFTLERFAPPRGRERRVAQLRGGSVEIEHDEPRRLELQVTDIGRSGRLILDRPPHTRWQLLLDGEEVELGESVVDDRGLTVMSATLPHAGHVVLSYEVSERERIAGWLSLVAIGLATIGVLISMPLPFAAPTTRTRTLALVAAAVIAIVAIAVLRQRQATKLEETWVHLASELLDPPRVGLAAATEEADEDAEPTSMLIRDLVDDNAVTVEQQPRLVCSGLLGKNVLEGCSEAAHAPSTSFLYREPYLHRCLRFSLPPKGHTDLQLPPLTEPGRQVVGTVIRHVRPGTGKAIRWGIGAEGRGPLRNRRHDFAIQPEPDTTMPPLRFRNDGNAIEQVCVALAEIER